jgi:putative ABC transport system permease protein
VGPSIISKYGDAIMMQSTISISGFIALSLLIIIPFVIQRIFSLHLFTEMVVAMVRMVFQLLLVGFFLTVVFDYNNPFYTILWVFVMIGVASFTIVRKSNLSVRAFFIPVLGAELLSVLLILLYIQTFVIQLTDLFDARYLITLGGMLLGNTLRGNIVGLQHFYHSLQTEKEGYLYHLASGATFYESLFPFIRRSIQVAINPIIGTMATMGIVSLPGMMTGQILAGSYPLVAIKYQIVIVIGIFCVMSLSVVLSIFFTLKQAFDSYGQLKESLLYKK